MKTNGSYCAVVIVGLSFVCRFLVLRRTPAYNSVKEIMISRNTDLPLFTSKCRLQYIRHYWAWTHHGDVDVIFRGDFNSQRVKPAL